MSKDWLPPNYPFLNPPHNHECCPPIQPCHPGHHHPHEHNVPAYHAGGFMDVNAFVLSNGYPYIRDNVCDKYGRRICVSENVRTTVMRRPDPSCINLTAKFDMTESVHTNTVLNSFLNKIIEYKHSDLDGILPVMKPDVQFSLFYTVRDECGDIVHESQKSVLCHELMYHPTEVADYFVTSAENVMVTNIPPMNFQGKYTLHLDKIVAYAFIVDPRKHLEEGDLNPFYQFTSNNTKVAVQHDTIREQEHDYCCVIAESDINHVVPFQANITTRVRMSFTAYMSLMISTPDTFGVWTALYASNDARIKALEYEVEQLTQEISALRDSLYQKQEIDALLDEKVDKVHNKGLSTNDYTDEDKKKVQDIPENVVWQVLE